MKTHQPIARTTIAAVAAIVKQLFVGLTGDICAADAKPLGVSEIDCALGEQMPVIFAGIAIVLSGGAVNAGDPVVSNSAGKAVVATTLSATVPGTGTTVTSSSAQPAMTIAGSVLPQAIAGYSLDTVGGANLPIRVLLA